jgi:hypothetical chaperone protein
VDRPTLYAIDFGTSNSLVAAASAARTFPPAPLDPAAPDPTILRSVLCFPEAGGVHVGVEALTTFVAHAGEARLLRSMKRHLGSRSFRGTNLGGRMVSAEALVGTLLRTMRERADAHYGAAVRRVLLGRPVHFDGEDDAFAEARLRRAAALAGFEEVQFLPEPVAAARAFAAAAGERGEAAREELALIGDFGGGTSDFTLLRITPAALERSEVLGVGGVAVAGDALDAALMREKVARHFGAEVRYRTPFGKNVLTMPHGVLTHLCSPAHLSLLQRKDVAVFLADVRRWALSRADQRAIEQLTVLVDDGLGFLLFEAIERAKKELSGATDAVVRFTSPGIDVEEPVTRAGLEQSADRELAAIVGCMEETVRRAGVGFEDVGVVCFTGGTARVPALAAALRARLPRARAEQFKGFHSVVEGLAWEAWRRERAGPDAPPAG